MAEASLAARPEVGSIAVVDGTPASIVAAAPAPAGGATPAGGSLAGPAAAPAPVAAAAAVTTTAQLQQPEKDPHDIRADEESKLTLHGLLQYYVKLTEKEKNRKLNDLLDPLEFNQVVIFVKSVRRAITLDKLLRECNFPSIAIHSGLSQKDRIARCKQFKEFQKRIMVSTDLSGRGIDIERANIVINYDMPDGSDSYLHRVGRAGCFGTKGLAITFIANEKDSGVLKKVQDHFEVNIGEMPSQIDITSYLNA